MQLGRHHIPHNKSRKEIRTGKGDKQNREANLRAFLRCMSRPSRRPRKTGKEGTEGREKLYLP